MPQYASDTQVSSNRSRTNQCALWYWQYHSLNVEVFDNQMDAATSALDMEGRGEASVAGVQFPDGAYAARDDWAEYRRQEELQTQESLEMLEAVKARPKPATRVVLGPSGAGDRQVVVPADTPAWVGCPVG